MKRLVFLVEGDTELLLINKHVIPFLYRKGFNNPMQAQKIVTNRKMNKKGGVINYEYLKNDMLRVLAQGNVIITTFLDFFRLPGSFPGYTSESGKVELIESAVSYNLGENPNIIPYIQLHEFEALLFSDIRGFEIVVDKEKEIAQLAAIIQKYDNPEDINNRPQTAPSKRLIDIFGYDKVSDGELIMDALGIEIMISKCPRFRSWIEKIEFELNQDALHQ